MFLVLTKWKRLLSSTSVTTLPIGFLKPSTLPSTWTCDETQFLLFAATHFSVCEEFLAAAHFKLVIFMGCCSYSSFFRSGFSYIVHSKWFEMEWKNVTTCHRKRLFSSRFLRFRTCTTKIFLKPSKWFEMVVKWYQNYLVISNKIPIQSHFEWELQKQYNYHLYKITKIRHLAGIFFI